MDNLPSEVWELIVARVEDRTLATVIPSVCKFFQKISSDNGPIWMLKSADKAARYTIEGVNKKTDQQSWKQFYFTDPLRLFPLWGISIGKSTRDDIIEILVKDRNLVSSIDNGPAIFINEIDFWCNDEDVFDRIDLVTQTSPIPHFCTDLDVPIREWQKFGITTDMTIEYAKQLLKECCGHCFVSQEQFLEQKVLTSRVEQQDGVAYDLTLRFSAYGYASGKVKLRSLTFDADVLDNSLEDE